MQSAAVSDEFSSKAANADAAGTKKRDGGA